MHKFYTFLFLVTIQTLTAQTPKADYIFKDVNVITMSEASRLQEAGVLFVKGEMIGGKTGKEGLVVVYKGEVLASGDTKR